MPPLNIRMDEAAIRYLKLMQCTSSRLDDFRGNTAHRPGLACYGSFPGMYGHSWNFLTNQAENNFTTCCVFLPTRWSDGYGQHFPLEGDPCMCTVPLKDGGLDYGEKRDHGCQWYSLWQKNVRNAIEQQVECITVVTKFIPANNAEARRARGFLNALGAVQNFEDLKVMEPYLGQSQFAEAAFLLSACPEKLYFQSIEEFVLEIVRAETGVSFVPTRELQTHATEQHATHQQTTVETPQPGTVEIKEAAASEVQEPAATEIQTQQQETRKQSAQLQAKSMPGWKRLTAP